MHVENRIKEHGRLVPVICCFFLARLSARPFYLFSMLYLT